MRLSILMCKNLHIEEYYQWNLLLNTSHLIAIITHWWWWKRKRGKKNCKESKKGRKNYESDIEMDYGIFDSNRYTTSEEEIEF